MSSLASRRLRSLFTVSCLLLAAVFSLAQNPDSASLREQAYQLYNDGNYREALNRFERLLNNPTGDNSAFEQGLARDLSTAVASVAQINEPERFDSLVESAIANHSGNWRLLWAAGNAYINAQHIGYVIGGDFQRGYQRGGGRYVDAQQRDRARALQLYHRAWELLQAQEDSPQRQTNLRTLLTSYASAIHFHGYRQSWRLQLLTDLETLPDYDEAYQNRSYLGAPVNADGGIVTYRIPGGFAEAINDGERWRFLLQELSRLDAGNSLSSQWDWANFLWREYGVQTLAESLNRYYYASPDPRENSQAEESLLDLNTLADDETIARLANGIQRFTLPDDYQFIALFERLSEQGGFRVNALEKLAEIYENRRQWSKAVEYWRQAIALSNGRRDFQQQRLDQIVGAWAQFEPLPVQADEQTNKTVNIRFRNAESIKLTAYRINTTKYLADLKDHLKRNPDQLDGNKVNLPSIGHYLLNDGEQYRGEILQSWTEDLSPAPDHQDKHRAIILPADLRGTYLLEATVSGGNTAYIVVWNADAIIVKRPMAEGEYYFLADAVTGQPLPDRKLQFFGFKTEWRDVNVAQRLFNRNAREMDVIVREFSLATDEQGQVIATQDQLPQDFRWLVHTDATADDFAFLGFQHIWYGRRYHWQEQQTKSFIVSKQPVYRPGQTVELKAWLRTASYTPIDNPHANQHLQLQIRNPQGKVIAEPQLTSDDYGGINYTLELSDHADLGVYRVRINGYSGNGQFRVEEYKKPEFEVSIEKPDGVSQLGDTINAIIKADYYFGAPVTNATVKVKVMRHEYTARWFPSGRWDWLYGSGYWWFARDMPWYPGWTDWGISTPRYSWMPYSSPPPELVMENELPIGPDGQVEISIDTQTAKLLHGNSDHRYTISAEVIDQSRRSVYASGEVLVSREAFQVFSWVDRGYYQLGDTVRAQFRAQSLDQAPVQGQGTLELYRIHYGEDNQVNETLLQTWSLDTDAEGNAELAISADAIGQHRLYYQVQDQSGAVESGGYIFNVIGDHNSVAADDNRFRFNALEVIPDNTHYTPGDNVQLMLNSRRDNAHIVLFERPQGEYPRPRHVSLNGNSGINSISVGQSDYPNFFVEAVTVFDGKVYTQLKEIAVPPQQSELQVQVSADKKEYRPGETAAVEVTLKDKDGEPFVGSTVVTVYDKALDYIAGDVSPPNIRDYFWQWKRQHYSSDEHSANLIATNLTEPNTIAMQRIGVFGDRVLERRYSTDLIAEEVVVTGSMLRQNRAVGGVAAPAPAPSLELEVSTLADAKIDNFAAPNQGASLPEVAVRSEFADAIYWNSQVETDGEGKATVTFTVPDNLTTWKTAVWAMGPDTQVGQGNAELVTNKDLLLRLQAPRFFVETDEVVLSANVHNYLEDAADVRVKLELDGEQLQLLNDAESRVRVDANGEQRVDWRVKVAKEGMASIRMLAVGDNESDAVQMDFPVYVHGQLITQSFSGALNKEENEGEITFAVPEQRRPEQSRLELRYSPTLAGAMVDALPYLVDYPYGCTEQTLSRFLPTILVQNVLQQTGIDLESVNNKRSNLNAQEIGDDRQRADQWGELRRGRERKNPVFDRDEVNAMVNTGLLRLHTMQLSDGGWGWFSGWGERSYPHTTAHVVRGLLAAKNLGLQVDDSSLQRGIQWLQHYQNQELQKLNNAATETQPYTLPYKTRTDNIDAFIAMVLADAGEINNAMLDKLFRDRLQLAVYSQALLGLTLHQAGRLDERDRVRRNIEQYLIRDPENQTAYLNLNNTAYWWYWYGSEFEAHAYYLKLLAKIEPDSDIAPVLVKYLLNNRKHATYWNSTRDTAIVIEAMADYLIASGEVAPDLELDLLLDGELIKTVSINSENLFSFDNKLVVEGLDLSGGDHQLEIRKRGAGPLYYNAYLSNFSLQDNLQKAGLELKVERRYYKLESIDATTAVAGSGGQALQQAVEKYRRIPIDAETELQSGELVEIELVIDSKNDYEYILIEDMKAAGFEPIEVRSGYNGNELGAYVEYRDNRVAFFVKRLARGTHNLSYRMKAEIPGKFSALPTKIEAMYAPELKANSDENKLAIVDE